MDAGWAAPEPVAVTVETVTVGAGADDQRDDAPERQRSLFSWAEFMAEEPAEPKGRSRRPEPCIGVPLRVGARSGARGGARRNRAAAAAWGVELRNTRPYRPQTNGKAERFIQILQHEWAYARPYRSNTERLGALPRWLYRYNHRRLHGGIGGAVPASRL